MEDIEKYIARFWSEAMQTLKEVVEKGALDVGDLPAREPGLPLPGVPCSQNDENHDPCK